jgi:hypothetical protein
MIRRSLLPVLVAAALLLAAGSASAAAGRCGSFEIDGHRLTDVRVTNVSCGQARAMIVRYGNTLEGLHCVVNDAPDAPPSVRCTGPVAAPGAGGRHKPRQLIAVIRYRLSSCDETGTCGI